MADGVAITAGSGTTVATDDAGASGHVQLFKLAYSADGVATLVPVDANGVLVNTELPAAAALSDTTANPTAPMAGAALMAFDGTEWERVKTAVQAHGEAFTASGHLAVVPLGFDETGFTTRMYHMTDKDAMNGGDIVGAGVVAYNGATMDRMRGTTANGLQVDVTRWPKAATSTLANVASSATSVVLRAAAATRMGLSVFNDSASVLYVKCGATASATSFTVRLGANEYWEMPMPHYTGTVDGIWTTAVGNARVTELTP